MAVDGSPFSVGGTRPCKAINRPPVGSRTWSPKSLSKKHRGGISSPTGSCAAPSLLTCFFLGYRCPQHQSLSLQPAHCSWPTVPAHSDCTTVPVFSPRATDCNFVAVNRLCGLCSGGEVTPDQYSSRRIWVDGCLMNSWMRRNCPGHRPCPTGFSLAEFLRGSFRNALYACMSQKFISKELVFFCLATNTANTNLVYWECLSGNKTMIY